MLYEVITLATAQVIGETLILKLGFQVELTDIRHIDTYKKRLETFDLLVVGSSIMRNRWVRKVLRFLKRNHFYNQSLALFVSAGQTLNQVQQFGYTREEAREQAVTKYIDPYLDKFRFEPIAKTAFGRITSYNVCYTKLLRTFQKEFNLLQGVVYAASNAIGFGLALVTFSGIRNNFV